MLFTEILFASKNDANKINNHVIKQKCRAYLNMPYILFNNIFQFMIYYQQVFIRL